MLYFGPEVKLCQIKKLRYIKLIVSVDENYATQFEQDDLPIIDHSRAVKRSSFVDSRSIRRSTSDPIPDWVTLEQEFIIHQERADAAAGSARQKIDENQPEAQSEVDDPAASSDIGEISADKFSSELDMQMAIK